FSWRWHPGLDLGGEYDEPIYAADSGVVVYSGWNTYGYGNTVILDHGNGWHTLYAHFNSVLVTCGEAVTQGQIIGLAGSTGRSTGPHLHFEMRLGGGYVNPWNYLPPP
ncbi:MAG: M23 family metallopeptidase, partial [Anaerolineales bacterium]|nr:M23 family metallopeptidase [Anaerolineales bacterium]